MGLRGMQDLHNLKDLLPLLQDPSRLISVFKLASSALLTFQTPRAPLALDKPSENFRMALPTSQRRHRCMECHRLLPRSNSRFTRGARARGSRSKLPSDEECPKKG